MKEELENKIAGVIKRVFSKQVKVELSLPDEQFGDFTSNIALQLSAELKKNPKNIAEEIARNAETLPGISTVSVAGPGFINIKLTDKVLLKSLACQPEQSLKNKVVVVEYSDPNPFKVLHAGHLYTSVVGDSIANILENAGAKVHRVNFGGDVGLHVAKTMWAILNFLGGEKPEKLNEVALSKRAEWLAECYVKGTLIYENNPKAKAEIIQLNKSVYIIHSTSDKKSPLAKIYWTTREWSYDYFKAFYKRIGTSFEKFYPESSVADLGLKIVKEQLIKGVFKNSDGAVVFEGDKHGLHTRVFINSEGLPTYEAKDIGLIFTKWEDYRFDKSVVITGSEQEQYMAVVLKSLEQFAPDLVHATSHLTHGIVKLKGGEKMSSRKGNILKAVDILDATARSAGTKAKAEIVLGAIKYSFLKQRTGGDIIYDPDESVALEGNSGPYLQYAYARAKNILAKSKQEPITNIVDLEVGERSLVRKLGEYPEVINSATKEMTPHLICTYLYELAQVFNRFYENNRVIGDKREAVRLTLVSKYSDILRSGLGLLGISAPDRM